MTLFSETIFVYKKNSHIVWHLSATEISAILRKTQTVLLFWNATVGFFLFDIRVALTFARYSSCFDVFYCCSFERSQREDANDIPHDHVLCFCCGVCNLVFCCCCASRGAWRWEFEARRVRLQRKGRHQPEEHPRLRCHVSSDLLQAIQGRLTCFLFYLMQAVIHDDLSLFVCLFFPCRTDSFELMCSLLLGYTLIRRKFADSICCSLS